MARIELQTINHQPSTINHQPSTINHQPSTINHQPAGLGLIPAIGSRPLAVAALAIAATSATWLMQSGR